MVVVPALTPVTIPELTFIVAVLVLLLFHVPPVVVFYNDLVLPVHTVPAPLMAPGAVFTVNIVVVELVSEPLVLHVPVPVHVSTQ